MHAGAFFNPPFTGSISCCKVARFHFLSGEAESVSRVSLIPRVSRNVIPAFPRKFYERHITVCASGGRIKVSPSTGATVKNLKISRQTHHLWKKRETAGSGQKASNLVRIISKLPNERETIYGALDKWIAWETEFPLVASAKALGILRKRNQWLRIIQVSKWMLSKGQGLTMGTYDTLLLAFDMDRRIDEAESLWKIILETHTRSVPKRLFSRMISLYDHYHMPEKLLEVFADMEELGVKPDEDTVRRIAGAFHRLGQEDKQKLVIQKYGLKWKYIHFNGERARIKVAQDDG